MKMTMKACMVLGLILAVSGTAQALTFNRAHDGGVNIQFQFVSTSVVDPSADGDVVNWGLYKVDTILPSGLPGEPAPGDTSPLWQNDTAPKELVGIMYGLRDQVEDDASVTLIPSVGPPLKRDSYVYGSGIRMAVYELDHGTYDAVANTPGITGTWSAASPGDLAGITDISAAVVTGHGVPIIDPYTTSLTAQPGYTGSTDPGSFAPDGSRILGALFEQKTRVIYDIAAGAIVDGHGVVYLDWDGGTHWEPDNTGLFGTGTYDWGTKLDVQDYQTTPRESMAVSAQTFDAVAPGSDYALAGWSFESDATIGSLETSTGLIPEPLTMFAVFGGIAGLGGYIRKRRTA